MPNFISEDQIERTLVQKLHDLYNVTSLNYANQGLKWAA
jgi:hypothetical protein